MASSDGTSLKTRTVVRLTGIRTHFPDQTFDPLTASAQELARYFLPPRPDVRQAPAAYANWHRAMISRPRFPTRTAMARSLGTPAVTLESSRNWSGGFVRPPNFDRMSLVQGRWIVPNTPPFQAGRRFASSVWVGLDGHDPASHVMPQIGTGQMACLLPTRPNGPVKAFDTQLAWWQLWVRDKHLWQVPIRIAIKRNDRIYAQVQALDPTTVSFYLKNETTNYAYAAYYYLTDDMPGEDLRPLERRTAAWIVERPLIPDHLGDGAKPISVPLAEYGETAFTDCNAATAAEDGSLQEFQLQRARLIRMNLWDDTAHPGRLASSPERVGDDVIRMRYVGPP